MLSVGAPPALTIIFPLLSPPIVVGHIESSATMGTKKMWDDEGSRELGWKQICITMRKAAVEMQEDKIRHNGRENVNSVLISGTETVALMAPSPSHAN